ncbi:MAG: SDR family oxidoreductase [Deltaproteobacteria bacterium]|jgi:short-subunit dehydrogenase|nr:SDR family oxidoreductase [Deltaproteobacteria bacterium]
MNYAVVTGASSGLGREFALKLAQRGYNLVITARRQKRLEELKKQVEDQYGRQCHLIVSDLSTETGVDKLLAAIDELQIEVEVLINNAGLGKRGSFEKISHQDIKTLIEVDIMALTRLAHHFYSKMVVGKGGYILNVASVAGFNPIPFFSVYGAAKTYVLFLSEALASEGKDKNIKITALCPGPVNTEFFDVAEATDLHFEKLLNSPEKVVDKGLSCLFSGQNICIPRGLFKAQKVMGKILPSTLMTWISKKIFKPDSPLGRD